MRGFSIRFYHCKKGHFILRVTFDLLTGILQQKQIKNTRSCNNKIKSYMLRSLIVKLCWYIDLKCQKVF